jgi:hypothetical protein
MAMTVYFLDSTERTFEIDSHTTCQDICDDIYDMIGNLAKGEVCNSFPTPPLYHFSHVPLNSAVYLVRSSR